MEPGGPNKDLQLGHGVLYNSGSRNELNRRIRDKDSNLYICSNRRGSEMGKQIARPGLEHSPKEISWYRGQEILRGARYEEKGESPSGPRCVCPEVDVSLRGRALKTRMV